MKQNHYIVTFNNGKTVFASGFNTEEVEILAKAVMIKNGLSYDIKSVKTTSNLSDMAGADLYAVIHNDTKTVEILPGETVFLDTGVTMEIPEGYVGLVFARSGLSCKQGLAPANKVGVIDADYRSSVKVALYNQSKEVRTVSDGDRIAQIIIQPVTQFEFKEVDKLSETNRGEGGFGSTGKA